MDYLWFFLISVAVAFPAYLFYRKKAVISNMVEAVNMVKFGLFSRLHSTYSRELNADEATLLAAAVTNFIFSQEPTKPQALQFQKENADRIETEARRLTQDPQICQLITQAVRTQTTVAHANAQLGARSAIDQLERLRSLGILVSDGEAPSPNTFIPAALALFKEAQSRANAESSP